MRAVAGWRSDDAVAGRNKDTHGFLSSVRLLGLVVFLGGRCIMGSVAHSARHTATGWLGVKSGRGVYQYDFTHASAEALLPGKRPPAELAADVHKCL